jgi:TonB family protein
MNHLRRTLVCLFICFPLLCAADSSKSVAHDLKGKTVYLRGMYAENDLNFDARGNPTTPATPGPFSISAIRVDETHLAGTTLEIEGRRIVLINAGTTDPPQPGDIRFVPTAPVHIVITGDPAHPESLASAVSKVLALSLDDALAGKTEEQRKAELFTLALLPPPNQPSPPPDSEIPDPANPGSPIRVYKAGEPGMTNPRAIYSVNPEFTDNARKKKINGSCILELIVDTNGFPIRVRMIRSIDPGLNENAIAAVSQYRFSPALIDGNPVPVEVKMEVTFRIY